MIYFIRSGNYVKIGYSVDPWSRLVAFQTGNPQALEMLAICPGDYEMERELSKAFSGNHYRGEWFCDSEAIQSYCQLMHQIFPHLQERADFVPGSQAKTNSTCLTDSLSMVQEARLSGALGCISENALNEIGISRFSNYPDSPAAEVMRYLLDAKMVEYAGDRKPYRWTSLGISAFPSPADR